MPEQAELWRKTSQRGLRLPATRGWNKDSERAITPAAEAACPCTLGAARVPTSQAAAPPSHSTLTGAELPQAKKNPASMGTGSLW